METVRITFKSRQYNKPELFLLQVSIENGKVLLRWNLNPRHTAYEAATEGALLAGPHQGSIRQGLPV